MLLKKNPRCSLCPNKYGIQIAVPALKVYRQLCLLVIRCRVLCKPFMDQPLWEAEVGYKSSMMPSVPSAAEYFVVFHCLNVTKKGSFALRTFIICSACIRSSPSSFLFHLGRTDWHSHLVSNTCFFFSSFKDKACGRRKLRPSIRSWAGAASDECVIWSRAGDWRCLWRDRDRDRERDLSSYRSMHFHKWKGRTHIFKVQR